MTHLKVINMNGVRDIWSTARYKWLQLDNPEQDVIDSMGAS
jgi:hypothetical protein